MRGFLCLLSLSLGAAAFGQTPTGGHLKFEQAVYDVLTYVVDLDVDPKTKSLKGSTEMVAKVVIPTNVILLDLDSPYAVKSVTDAMGRPLRHVRAKDTIRIWFPQTLQPGEEFRTKVAYSGTPRLAPNAPWVGGFMWTKTPSGADWISIAMQNDGADILFPCKDHPSDKPATAVMRIIVPDPLMAVGPGKLVRTVKNSNGTTAYHWQMTNPIPNYSILFNAAPYVKVADTMRSVAGDTIPIELYVLPENRDKAARLMEETKKYTAFMEKYVGPFPFRSQKLGIVETPHLGMEHSTAIAYGNKYRFDANGFDWLLLHELGHEWWANLVTGSDWRDFWIHEGFQTYMDALYKEHTGDKAGYLAAMKAKVGGIANKVPLAPREPTIAHEFYNHDIYDKGALVLHTLRYLIGDDAFFRSLRRMAYPTPEMEKLTDGRQTRLVTTDDFIAIAERESGKELDWFFDVYVRQPVLPHLEHVGVNRQNIPSPLSGFKWVTPNNLPFPMPLEVVINGKTTRIEIEKSGLAANGVAVMPNASNSISVDPQGWILRGPTTGRDRG